METQYFKDYSPSLGREMESKVYGHAGRPILFIPCQDGRFFDFDGFSMTDTWSPWIESGQVRVMAIDTIDKETFSDTQMPTGEHFYCAFAGRREGKDFLLSHEELADKYHANMKMIERIPDALAGAMGNQMFVGIFSTKRRWTAFMPMR